MLDEAKQHRQEKRFIEALAATERALKAAKQAKDAVGEALSCRLRATLLAALDRKAEAVAAWEAAGAAWKQAGDEPGQVEALAAQALLAAVQQPEEAKRLLEQAVQLAQAEVRRPRAVAGTLNQAGIAFDRRGRLADARTLWSAALAISEKQAPGSLDVAICLNNLGVVARSQGDLTAARDYYQRALAIQDKQAPGSLDVAGILNNLGGVAQLGGDLAAAEDFSQQAWDAVRHQGVAVVGDDARQAFGDFYLSYAARLVGVQRVRGHLQEAFLTLEQGRAQALQQLLWERGLFARLAPPELWKEYQQAQRKLDRTRQTLETAYKPNAAAEARETAEHEAVSARTEVQKRLAAMKAAVQRSQPEAIPVPRDPAQARRQLPPGTLFVAFALTEREGVLFLARSGAGAEAVRAFPLDSGTKVLAPKVLAMRELIDRLRGTKRGVQLALPSVSPPHEQLVQATRELYGMLFPHEARAAMEQAQRLIISPDGVLWDLPFAALVTNATGEPVFLGLQKPLCYAQSLTLYARSLEGVDAAPGGPPHVLVVGNPLYDPARRAEFLATAAAPSAVAGRVATPEPVAPGTGTQRPANEERGVELRAFATDGLIPPELPHAEAEARQVAKLYGGVVSKGGAPTEAWFRKEAGPADLIHLATHGYFHPRLSLSSGVLLAVPETTPPPNEKENDGTVQGWELMSPDFPRLHADLVVLSACETAMGQKVSGEGLVGLTRALQVAGARSIVASQWAVADESTKELMVAFHQRLRAGVAKDEALLAAMREVAGRWPGPYHWAPFLLVGDPRNHTLGANGGQAKKRS